MRYALASDSANEVSNSNGVNLYVVRLDEPLSARDVSNFNRVNLHRLALASGFVNHVVGLVDTGLGSNALQLSFSTGLGRRAWIYLVPPTVDVRRAEAKYILPLTASVGPRFTIRGLIGAARRSGACNPIFGRRSDLLPFKF